MRYPSNVSDEEWEMIRGYVEPSKKGRKSVISRRAIVDGIFYQSRTGCQWEYLPSDFPNYKTINGYYNQWIRSGIWQKLHDRLVESCRSALGKKR